MLDPNLIGKVALVTGGSDGLGRATAMRLILEGANVAICARRDGPLEEDGALAAQALDDAEQAWLDPDPDGEDVLTQLQGASMRYRIAVGPIARLAALVPRPRSHLVRFLGLFAPNARHRRLIVPSPPLALAAHDAEPEPVRTRAQL